MELFLGWIIFSGLAAWLATQKGRSGFAWFLLSFLLSPLFGIIGVAIAPSLKK